MDHECKNGQDVKYVTFIKSQRTGCIIRINGKTTANGRRGTTSQGHWACTQGQFAKEFKVCDLCGGGVMLMPVLSRLYTYCEMVF